MLIQGEYVGLVLCDSADYFYYLFNAHPLWWHFKIKHFKNIFVIQFVILEKSFIYKLNYFDANSFS